jgi:CheY-like chemotaxis protein
MALVLVIEDDALMRRMVQRVLVSDGHTVIEAENGGIGLDLLRTHDAELVITDILMPETEGLETIRGIRKSNQKIKILAISGGGAGADAPVLTWARRLGADAMLPKPFRATELLEAVHKLLSPGT